jgi:hypothetical protein
VGHHGGIETGKSGCPQNPNSTFTMQVSLATRSHPRPNLDDRPKFKVAIIYEDGPAGKRAKYFYDKMIRELVDECDFSLQLWNFQVLAISEIGNSAAQAAAQADFVYLDSRWTSERNVSFFGNPYS